MSGQSAQATNVSDLGVERSRRFFRDIHDHPFVACVLMPDGTVKVFQKDVDADVATDMCEALAEAIIERTDADADEDA